jgi:very-short-patch-repair endonuclease/RecA/RadA recombinase
VRIVSALRLQRLIDYYLACLETDGYLGARIVASDSRWFELDLRCEWHSQGLRRIALSHQQAQIVEECDRGWAYGWPVWSIPATNGSPAQVVPVIIRSITHRHERAATALEPTGGACIVNPEFLSALQAQVEDIKRLGRVLSDACSLAEDGSLIEVARILREQTEIEAAECISLNLASGLWPTLNRPALVNRAVIVRTEPNPFTRGVESELRRMKSLDANGTSLAALVGDAEATLPSTAIPVLEPGTLDEDQREAVRGALCSRVVAVTGPPGTGKSRVVVGVVANCLARGEAVLVASRNHQALNVIESRLEETLGTDLALRIGVGHSGADLRRELVEKLRRALRSGGLGSVLPCATSIAECERLSSLKDHLQDRLSSMLDGHARTRAQHRSWLAACLAALTDLLTTLRTKAGQPKHTPPMRKGRLAGESITRLLSLLSETDGKLSSCSREYIQARAFMLRRSCRDGAQRAALATYASMIQTDEHRRACPSEVQALFEYVLRSYPVWCTTSLSAHQAIPLCAQSFDQLIIDEASQSDIASTFPLMLRAKRVLILGDAQQLRHITSVGRRIDTWLMAKHGIDATRERRFAYTTSSVFDLALASPATTVRFLSTHYRSHPAIVTYINELWYEGRLRRVSTECRGDVEKAGIHWIDVHSDFQRDAGGGGTCPVEIAAIERLLPELRAEDVESIAVLSPFRAQVGLLRQSIERVTTPAWRALMQLTVGTPQALQGDERDTVVLSLCVAKEMPAGCEAYLRETAYLLNVAVSRARHRVIVVGDWAAAGTSDIAGIRALAAAAGWQHKSRGVQRRSIPAGPHEAVLFDALERLEIRPLAQYPVGRFVVDLAVITDNVRIAIEIDGKEGHLDIFGRRTLADVAREFALRDLGWRIERFSARTVEHAAEDCARRIQSLLAESVSAACLD